MELHMDYAGTLAVERGAVAPLLKGEGAPASCREGPVVVPVEGIFRLDEGGVLVGGVGGIAVASEDDGRPEQPQRKPGTELVGQLGIEEAAGGACRVVEELPVVVRGTRREIIRVPKGKGPSARLELSKLV